MHQYVSIEINNKVISLGFKRKEREPCIYSKKVGNDIIILAYVDDISITSSSTIKVDETIADISKHF